MRVKVVEIQKRHLKLMYCWELDKELQEKTGIEQPRTYQQFLHSFDAYFNGEKPNLYLRAIEADGELVGKVELFMTEDDNFIGMVIARSRRSGIGTRALQFFLEDLKKNKHIEQVHAEVYEDNEKSLRFFLKNGFELTGETNEEWFRDKKRTLVTLVKEM